MKYMKSFNKYFFLLFVLLTVLTIDVKAAAKAGEATVKVNATTTVSLATTYQTTLRNSTGISARWSTSSSNISITSQTNTSATIKGVSAGTAQLNYYCSYYINGYYRTMDFYYTITIESSGSTSNLTISPTSITLDEGDTYSVTAYQPGYQGGVYFTSNNSNIANVSTGNSSGYYTYGTVTAISAGTTYIYAKSMNGATSSACTVTVRAKTIPPTSIYLPGSKTIEEGEYAYITASVSPSNATYTLSWSSSNTDVATVSSAGRVYGKKPGTARITAKINGYSLSDYCDVTVKAKQVIATKLSIEGPSTLPLGESFQLVPIYEPNNATTVFSYVSNNESVATVSSTGLITAVGVGNTTITITETISKLSSTIEITVPEQEIEDTDISILENALYIENVNGIPGATINLKIKLKNIITAYGCAFNLTLPKNFSLLTDESGDVAYNLSNRAKKMLVISKDWKDGNYDFALIAAESSATITGTDDIFITFKLVIPNDAEGDYKLFLTDNLLITMVDEIVQDKMLEDIVTTLNVSEEYEPDNGDEEIEVTDITEMDNVLYVESKNIFADGLNPIQLKMKNSAEVTAVEFILELPEGMSFESVILLPDRVTSRADFVTPIVTPISDQKVHVMIYPSDYSNVRPFTGNNGGIARIKIKTDKDIALGEYPLLLRDVKVSDKNGETDTNPYVKSVLTIIEGTLGDANNNDDVEVGDIMSIINYMSKHPSSRFQKGKADVNGDDEVDISDIMGVVNTIVRRIKQNSSMTRTYDIEPQ
jgi:uncharacterized protein YjdB